MAGGFQADPFDLSIGSAAGGGQYGTVMLPDFRKKQLVRFNLVV
jgi:hypothetical protein